MHAATSVTATQFVEPSAGPKDVVPVHAVQLASAVAVPPTLRGALASRVLAVQSARRVHATQSAEPSAGPKDPAAHGLQTASVVAVAETLRAELSA